MSTKVEKSRFPRRGIRLGAVVIVASHNGLGHTMRSLRLARAMAQLGVRPTLLVGPEQSRFVQSGPEESIVCLPERLETWVDGPHVRTPVTERPSSHTNSMLSIIESAECVVSDNALWPADFNSNTYVYSHFLWIDYYRNTEHPLFTKELAEVELRRLSKVRGFMGPMGFTLDSAFLDRSQRVDVKMPRYQEFESILSKPRGDTCWMISGKTGSNLSTSSPATLASFNVYQRVPADLLSAAIAPKLFVGRPGMGSIGESLSAGIPFVPHFFGSDWELENNAQNLHRLGLSPEFGCQESLEALSHLKLESCNHALQDFRTQFMTSESQWAYSVLDLVGNGKADFL